MAQEEVTHKEIYTRLCDVELKVDKLTKDTEGMVSAFNAAQGAFTVLDWVSKAAKPIIWIVGSIVALTAFWNGHK